MGVALILIMLIVPIAAGTDPQALPADVYDFIAQRDLCAHVEKEKLEAQSAMGAELRRQASLHCPSLDRKLQDLRSKYRDNEQVLRELPKAMFKTERQ